MELLSLFAEKFVANVLTNVLVDGLTDLWVVDVLSYVHTQMSNIGRAMRSLRGPSSPHKVEKKHRRFPILLWKTCPPPNIFCTRLWLGRRHLKGQDHLTWNFIYIYIYIYDNLKKFICLLFKKILRTLSVFFFLCQ